MDSHQGEYLLGPDAGHLPCKLELHGQMRLGKPHWEDRVKKVPEPGETGWVTLGSFSSSFSDRK